MSARRAALPALAGLAVSLLLGAHALGALPAGVRVALALVALVLLPGHALLAAADVVPPGGAALATGWALGLGTAWLAALVLLTRALHLPFTALATTAAWPAAALWALPAWRARRARAGGRDAGPRAALGPGAGAAVALAALVAAVHCAQLPPPLSPLTDSPDHVGTLRRMLAEGDAFPADAFFAHAGAAGVDPRKGLWHPCVALIARLAGVDALAAWEGLAAPLAALFALNAAAFAFLLGGGAYAAAGAWALVLAYGGSLATAALREAVLATKLADQLALATAAAVLADLAAPKRARRAVAVGLALGAVAAHVFAAIQFAVVFGALGVGLLVRERGAGAAFRRLAATAAWLGAACLPYLLWRARGAYAPANPIHTEPQGLLDLAGGAYVVSPGAVWDWFGGLWLVLPCSLVAWARAARRDAALYLLTATLAVAVLMFCPPVVERLEPRLGYLLMRLPWLLPMSAALAFAGVGLARAAARGAPAAVAAALALALLLAGPVGDAADALVHPGRVAAAEAAAGYAACVPALVDMDRRLPAGSVVLADPATSYAIPVWTRDYVVDLADQHSSPNDPRGLERILDARDALDPYATWERTAQVIRRWGVTAVALNGRFSRVPPLDYWAPGPAWFEAARARLDAAPRAFPKLARSPGFALYGVDPAALDSLHGALRPRPFVTALAPGGAPSGGGPGPRLVRLSLSGGVAAPGDSLAGALEWTAPRACAPGSYRVVVRFDAPLPAGRRAPAWCSKPWRKLLERLTRRRWRFREDHLPVNGAYGVDAWRPGEAVRDSFGVRVPADAAPGTYVVRVTMLHSPHYPNLRLRDLLSDDDFLAGVPAGTLRVTPRAAARAPAPAGAR